MNRNGTGAPRAEARRAEKIGPTGRTVGPMGGDGVEHAYQA